MLFERAKIETFFMQMQNERKNQPNLKLVVISLKTDQRMQKVCDR